MTELEFGLLSWSFPVMDTCIGAVKEKCEEYDLKFDVRNTGGQLLFEVTGATTAQLVELQGLSGHLD